MALARTCTVYPYNNRHLACTVVAATSLDCKDEGKEVGANVENPSVAEEVVTQRNEPAPCNSHTPPPPHQATTEKEIGDCWLFDADDEPFVGPDGPDEKDRVLVDEFHSGYVLLDNRDHPSLTTLFLTLLDICLRGCPCTSLPGDG